MAKSRYIGDYPVIGIRPIVDGRRGPMQLRESLENQVMAMANAAKKLFEENLFYSNGEPVKVVMADSTIGRVPEAAACANKFQKEGVSITLPLRLVGATVAKRWTWTPRRSKPFGALTVRSVPARCTLRRFWRDTRKRACPRSVFTDTRYKTAIW